MRKRKILMIENSKKNSEVLTEILEDTYDIILVQDVKQAMFYLEQYLEEYCLVLLDIDTFGIDAYTVLREMKEQGFLSKLPVIAVSEEKSIDVISQAYDYGASDYIVPPFHAFVIRKRIENVIDLYERKYKDYVTGGYNRSGFVREAIIFLRNSENVNDYALLYFNIKNFKAINELYGIKMGNEILKLFYNYLQESALKPILVARGDADHFICLVRKQDVDEAEVTRLCRFIYDRENQRMKLYGRCGIYTIKDRVISVDSMLDCAKIAKKYIKDEYIKPFAWFEPFMNHEYMNRAEFSEQLEKSLKEGEFLVYYQPIRDFHTKKIRFAEALVRWNHPDRGLIKPQDFVGIFEKDGNLAKLDLFVLKSAYRTIQERYRRGEVTVPITFNISWTDFYNKEFMNWLVEHLQKNENPKWIECLELTEESYVVMQENNREALEKIEECGAKILLDKFGSGYSSFSMMQNQYFNYIKVDLIFTRQIGINKKTEDIVKTLIDMAHELGTVVMAEGAESQEQAEILSTLGCDYIQGHYDTEPLSEEMFIELLEKGLHN